ncbi:LOW QUALITY PROTEIN: uncharacterized protein LOC130765036 [Actinidia eriantha]|uniref:LOW QUALITY PROTEIN: uncharacterized protein LOC130765036 n=1 Tax=Actinidia eriantha TaxID=165200 RepID=UPI002590DD1D|nr:LOW QUALITY PROTEIN: uncharacterized protein LOC130765036 [Actinidia eriantha]
MKSRSHRLPTSDPPDDWVNGSWTVDCVCGVNFDDGEEMVNCDECGVWVHTRCSRYVKSEKSFACDKCKIKNTRNDSEETEVAQLLVELPTKTLRIDNPLPPRVIIKGVRSGFTDIPIEERVHVQGIPGGEPGLFGGLSSVFSPELWKCTGYVPKKFNMQYREFPCWDEEEEEEEKANAKVEEENENPLDKGAGVLFSLSKKNVMATPMTSSIGMKRQVVEGGSGRLSPCKDMKKWDVENRDVSCPQNSVKKDRALLQPFVIHTGKPKKEDSWTSKDRNGKKKVKVVDGDGDHKKRVQQVSKTASTHSSGAKKAEFYDDGGLKIVKADTQSMMNVERSDVMLKDPLPGDRHVVENIVDKLVDNLGSGEHPSETLVSEVSGHSISMGARSEEEKFGHQVSTRTESSSKTDDEMASLLEHSDPGSVPIKEEGIVMGIDNANDKGGGSSISSGSEPHKSEPLVEDSSTAIAEGKYKPNCQGPSLDMNPSSVEPCAEVKSEADLDNSGGTFNVEATTTTDVRLDGTQPLDQHSGDSADHLSAVTSLQLTDFIVPGGDGSIEGASNCEKGLIDDCTYDPSQPKRHGERPEGSIAAEKSSSELKQDSRMAEEPSKLGSTIVIPRVPSSQRKTAAPSSASSTIVISKRSVPDNLKPSNEQNHNLKQGALDSSISIKKDSGSTEMVGGEDRREMPRKILKECSKSSVSSVLRVSPSSKISHTSNSKKTSSYSKDPVPYTSSKASSAQNIGVTSGSAEPAGSLQAQSTSHVQTKILASGLPHKGEKVNQSNSQSSTKVYHTVPVHRPAPLNSSAILSDEELALLLHQELNSSPRVPRVPRMRHTGSLPQLGSPTAASMLIKRTSSSGGRDHSVFARRKAKDLPKHGSRCSGEMMDDDAKMDRLARSPDLRRHDSASAADAFTKREADSGHGKGAHAIKKSAPAVSTATVSSGPSSSPEANEQNFASMCNSPRNTSDDDTGNIKGPTHCTLPGLIAEIMSKGKRMTYEELCSAVLPHWPNLRKHNGERYAYSSHSQAVLDCLRNRHEWAQLVDRGPKTNAGRKRRKLDAEAPSFESEDNEYGKDTTAKEVESKSFESHREEFPKGKRKARKRRRLALRGRGIKDVRRRRKADVHSDDDVGSFSSSSDVSMFSDEEVQGGETRPVGSEASASSDEMGT